MRQLLGSRSLANRNGADHRARRRVVGQLFSAAALRRYTPAITQLVEALAADLNGATQPVALVERMRRFAFAVIASVVLGLEGDDSEALFADFEIWTRALFSVPIALPGTPFDRALKARARLLQRLRGVLERAQERPTGGLDLLSGGLDEAGLPLTDDDLVEQLLLLLFAGYETTASSLSCLMAALLQHPAELAWLQEEIHALAWPLAEGAPTPRLSAVVQEVMRLNPPVGGFFRRTTQPLELAGVLVPAGQVVQVALAASNRLARGGADDLDAFRPQRHLEPDNGLTLLPFGGGDRVCLGKALAELEIRLMAVGLLRQCRLQLLPDPGPQPGADPQPQPAGWAAGGGGLRRNQPGSAWASTVISAVSTLRTRSPRLTRWAITASASCSSNGTKPPSGPIITTAGSGGASASAVGAPMSAIQQGRPAHRPGS